MNIPLLIGSAQGGITIHHKTYIDRWKTHGDVLGDHPAYLGVIHSDTSENGGRSTI